ncbi:adenosine kinase 1 [Nephila pilipes]|uniref:Adenosine kinase n=1 Tax=Nephila pilipes TaxID=299642 RepID=A0A8X6T6J8_NEPPI|nr:adenosine kinase 1 [Nephila pilipes]
MKNDPKQELLINGGTVLNNSEDKGMDEAETEVLLVFVGSPLLDISTRFEEKILEQYDLKIDGCVRAAEKHCALFQDLFLDQDSVLVAGGSAQNSARIAKRTLGSKGEVAFTGCTGCDEYEEWMKNQLRSEGVLPLYVTVPEEKTGVCACMTCDGMRSMCTRQGAAAKFAKEHLFLEPVNSKLKMANCIFVVGYFLGHSPDVVLNLAELCSPTQVFSLSLSAEYICRDYSEVLLKVMPRVDVLFGNETEVKAFATAVGGPHITTVEEAVKLVSKLQRPATLPSRILIITRGSDPVVVDDGSDHLLFFEVPEDVPVVDSVGCGDALAGAFLATYIRTRDIDSSVRAGIDSAVQILQVHGCDATSIRKSDI